jgi:hypothetical protein
MPKITECLIGIKLAKAIRGLADAAGLKVPEGDLSFRCPNPDCRKPVRIVGDHFEHFKRNPSCPLSHVSPNRVAAAAGVGK